MKRHRLLFLFSLSLLTFIIACKPEALPAAPSVPVTPGPIAAQAQSNWEIDWEKTLSMGRQERSVVIYSTMSGDIRQAISKSFNAKYGIELELVSARGTEVAEKIATLRRAGLFLADVFIGGSTTPTTTLKPRGDLQPLKPLLVLPEVIDQKLWFGGGLVFTDKERQYVACPVLTTSNSYNSANTDLVKEGEFASYKDLLNTKWKGKIIINDPTIAGAGSRWFAVVADQYTGLDYMRSLVNNAPAITRDQRLQVEGLARGKYSIAIGAQPDILVEFIKLGAPVKKVVPGEGAWLGGGPGLIAYVNNAPHPNASKIFINWFMSKEGQTIYSRIVLAESARLDVPTDHLNKDDLRDPAVKYFISEEEEFLYKIREYEKNAREIFTPLLK